MLFLRLDFFFTSYFDICDPHSFQILLPFHYIGSSSSSASILGFYFLSLPLLLLPRFFTIGHHRFRPPEGTMLQSLCLPFMPRCLIHCQLYSSLNTFHTAIHEGYCYWKPHEQWLTMVIVSCFEAAGLTMAGGSIYSFMLAVATHAY